MDAVRDESGRVLVDRAENGRYRIVIVTHNMQQAARVSQNCAFFLATHDTPGRIVEAGPTRQLFEDPRDERTSDYVNGRFG